MTYTISEEAIYEQEEAREMQNLLSGIATARHAMLMKANAYANACKPQKAHAYKLAAHALQNLLDELSGEYYKSLTLEQHMLAVSTLEKEGINQDILDLV